MEGWLKKKSPRTGVMQWRFFRLHHGLTNALLYYKKEEDKHNDPVGAIPLKRITEVKEQSPDDLFFLLVIEGNIRQFVLLADTSAVRTRWVEAIRSMMVESHALTPLRDDELKMKWWKPYQWSQRKLLDTFLQEEAEQQMRDEKLAIAKQKETRDVMKRNFKTAMEIKIINQSGFNIFVAPYTKPLTHKVDEYELKLIDANSIVRVPTRESDETDYPVLSVLIPASLVDESVKLVFSLDKEELTPELSRRAYITMIRHPANNDDPVYLRNHKPRPLIAQNSASMNRAALSEADKEGDKEEEKKPDVPVSKFFVTTARETAEAGLYSLGYTPTALDAQLCVDKFVKQTKCVGGFWVSPYDWQFTVLKYPWLVAGSGAGSEINPTLIPAPLSRTLAFLTKQEIAERQAASENYLKENAKVKRSQTAGNVGSGDEKPILPFARGKTDTQLISLGAKVTPPTAKLLSLVFLGDMMAMDREIPPKAHPTLRRMFGNADIVFVNMEAVVRRIAKERDVAYKSSTTLAFPVGLNFVQEALQLLNIEPTRAVFTMANNHAGDFGEDAIHEAVQYLNRIGATVVGVASERSGENSVLQNRGLMTKIRMPPCANCVYQRQQAQQARFGESFNSNAMKAIDPSKLVCQHDSPGSIVIGVVGWSRWMNNDTTNSGLPIFREADVVSQDWRAIKAAEKVDYLVGYVHWDYEQSFISHISTTGRSRELLRFGMFDAIVGHGPHVLQSVEVFDEYTRRQLADSHKDGSMNDLNGICAYSVGNICSERGKWQTKMGGAFELVLDPNNKTHPLFSYKMVPYIQKYAVDEDRDDHDDDFQMTMTPVEALDERNKTWDDFRDRLDLLFETPFGVLRKFLRYPAVYRIRTWTSSKPFSGTNTPVYLTARGFIDPAVESDRKANDGSVVSQEWLLRNNYKEKEYFRSGTIDSFYVGNEISIGAITTIRIALKPEIPLVIEGTEEEKKAQTQVDRVNAWVVDRITITSLNDGEEFIFEGPFVVRSTPVIAQVYRPSKLNTVVAPNLGKNPMLTYRDIAKDIKTGDLIAFQSSTWYAAMTRTLTNSPYSHVGIAVVMNSKQIKRHHIKETFAAKLERAKQKLLADDKKDGQEEVKKHQEVAKDAADVGSARLAALHKLGTRDLNELADDDDDDDDDDGEDENPEERQVLIYESTKNGDNTPDVTTGYNNFVGVHGFEARQRITSYAGKIFHIPLKERLNKKGEREMRRWILEQHRKKTPFDYFQMFGAGVLKNFGIGNVNDLAEMFCSEFVTACLQFGGAVDKDKNASEMTPADVSNFPCFEALKVREIKPYAERKGIPIKEKK